MIANWLDQALWSTGWIGLFSHFGISTVDMVNSCKFGITSWPICLINVEASQTSKQGTSAVYIGKLMCVLMLICGLWALVHCYMSRLTTHEVLQLSF